VFAFIGWLIIVLIISVIPIPETGINSELHLDKVVHFLLYGITAILFYKVLRLGLKQGYIFFPIALASLYGLLLEVVQHFVSYRSFSLADIIANILGAMVFVLAYTFKNYFNPA
jgi:VanZ family protein